ncbi:MAG: FtsW/RodA/SpoVE family cell cycle protein [Tannerellaceae bacterium]|jgi:cell division protein FtsW|nr:FtsW/RodA/SpoVE family cell cycle protein [Tannerellaceae bacterium]
MNLANILFKGDKVIWIIFLLLCLISIIEVFSATSTLTYKDGDYWGPIFRHASFLLGGALLILLIHNIPCRFFSALGFLLPVSAVLLGFTMLFGVEINDSSRWMSLFGIRFQPSEIAKLSCIVYVAFLLSRRKMFSDKQIFNCILLGVSLICALIFPENFSTSVILFVVCFLMLVIGWVSPKKIALLFLALVLLGASFFFLLHTLPDEMVNKSNLLEKIKNRTEKTFKETPPLDAKTYKIDDYNRQETYAKIAIANGGLTGKLPGLGQQRDTLPQAYSDFIYAIVIEEMGIIIGFFVLFLYIALMIRVGAIAHKCDKLFPKYLVLGCGLLIGVQALANMAVVVGLFPVTGQPLPLVSRGGTSTVITCVYFGIILSISRFGAGIGNEEEEEEEDDEEEEEELPIEIETPTETNP